ncbi:MAG: twin-arginine translocase subunit TatC [Bacteroidales bacterium]|nr:twin-arginine translocase subunit TatC [Bacteroidales bacterium]
MADASGSGEMSFWDHLEELRWTLLRSVAAVCILSVLGFIFKGLLFKIILWPAQSVFIIYRLLGWNMEMDLINVDISAQFFIHLKAAVAVGLVLAFPYIIWEIWRFVAPALYPHEKKAVGAAFLMSSGFFYLGVLVGYFFVLPVCLQFFMNYSVSPDISNTITVGSYMSMFMSMSLLIGIVFEFPTVIAVLSRLGVVTRALLRKGRKYALVIVLALAALITPSDPFSMLVLAAPLYLLYELSILLCRDGIDK